MSDDVPWRYLVAPGFVWVLAGFFLRTPILQIVAVAVLGSAPGVVDACFGGRVDSGARHRWRVVSLELMTVLGLLAAFFGVMTFVVPAVGIASSVSTVALHYREQGLPIPSLWSSPWTRYAERAVIVGELVLVVLAHVLWIVVRYRVGYGPRYNHPESWSTPPLSDYPILLGPPMTLFLLSWGVGPFATISAVTRAFRGARVRSDIVWAALAFIASLTFWWDPFGARLWFMD